MKPRILISGCDESRFLYENAVEQAGGIAVSYYCPPLDESCDGLLLCGGNDVSPRYYGQENTACEKLDPKRDEAEIALIRSYMKLNKPILGICRGMQILNVALGGTMIQDIGEQLHKTHSGHQEPLDKIHPIHTEPGSLIRALWDENMMVNTIHHQAVDRLGDNLRVTAWSEDGLVEALEHEKLSMVGLQWHPERISNTRRRQDTVDGAPIFSWLISEAGKAIK